MKKYLLVIFIFLLGTSQVFAQTNSDGSGLTSFFQNLLQIVSVMQSIWMIPAALAGALMSNNIVTGNAFGMTQALNGLWRISHNLAFMILGFLFVAGIFQVFFKKDQPLTSVRKLIGQIAISSILISASWFIIMVLLDISSILTFTASSFFSSVVGNSVPVHFNNYCEKSGTNPTCGTLTDTQIDEMNKKFNNTTAGFTLKKMNDQTLANMFPNVDFMAGPLLYLGKDVIQVDKFNFKPNANDWKTQAVNVMTQLVIFLMFLIPIIILLITNFIRVFWVWLWLALAPFVVLINVFGWKKINIKGIEFKNIIALIFQPVIIVTALSFSLLFIYSMTSILVGENAKKSPDEVARSVGYTIFEKGAFGSSTYTVVVPVENQDDVVWSGMRNGIGYFIVSLFGIALVWALLKAATTSNQITGSIASGLTGFVEGFAKTLPLVPIPGGGAAGFTSLQNSLNKRNIGGNTFDQRNQEMVQAMETRFGLRSEHDLSSSDGMAINNAMNVSNLRGDPLAIVSAGFAQTRDALSTKDKVTLQTASGLKAKVVEIMSNMDKNSYDSLGITLSDGKIPTTYEELMKYDRIASFIGMMLGATNLSESALNIKTADAGRIRNTLDSHTGLTATRLSTTQLGKDKHN